MDNDNYFEPTLEYRLGELAGRLRAMKPLPSPAYEAGRRLVQLANKAIEDLCTDPGLENLCLLVGALMMVDHQVSFEWRPSLGEERIDGGPALGLSCDARDLIGFPEVEDND